MLKKTARQAVYDIVENYPDLGLVEIYSAIKKLGYEITKEEAEGITADAKFAQSTATIRFKDLAPDNNIYELNIEKKGHLKFGIVSDTHFGSKTHKRAELEKTINIMLNEGVSHFFGAGDLLEGYDVYPGQASEIVLATEDEQVGEAIAGLPMLTKDKKYYWVSGNHDLIWLKKATGSDPLVLMHESRPDFEYLGKYSAYLYIAPKICIQLVHPSAKSGTSWGYAAQKFLDKLWDERRPEIAVFGHWHNPASFVHKNTHVELSASFQGPNSLSIRNGWANTVGGKIVDIQLDRNGEICRYKTEEILFWEPTLKTSKRIKL